MLMFVFLQVTLIVSDLGKFTPSVSPSLLLHKRDHFPDCARYKGYF